MRKIFFSDLSCTHGRTCIYGRYAPVVYRFYLRNELNTSKCTTLSNNVFFLQKIRTYLRT